MSHAATPDLPSAAAHDTNAAAQDIGPGSVEAVAVLRELLAEERRKSDSLLESSLIWQTRALQLQERLAALEAGPIVAPAPSESANTPQDAQDASRRVVPPQTTSRTLQEAHTEPVPAQVQLAVGWRRWFRWLMES